jgi:hypothetical protein
MLASMPTTLDVVKYASLTLTTLASAAAALGQRVNLRLAPACADGQPRKFPSQSQAVILTNDGVRSCSGAINEMLYCKT